MGNQLDEIKKLYASAKEYKIPKNPKEGQVQATISITPLGLDDIASLDMNQDAPMSEIAAGAKKLFAQSLKIEEDEVGKLSFEFMEELLTAIMDANNFNEADLEKTGVKKFLKQKRELIKKEKEINDSENTEKASE